MSYLLDTCVISELVAKQPNPKVIAWIDGIDDEEFYLSVVRLGEIERGIEKLVTSKRKQMLQSWLEDELTTRFIGRILNIDVSVMRVWGRLTAQMEKKGRTLPILDSLIAALALHTNLQLVTRNEEDFIGTGVSIINPWK